MGAVQKRGLHAVHFRREDIGGRTVGDLRFAPGEKNPYSGLKNQPNTLALFWCYVSIQLFGITLRLTMWDFCKESGVSVVRTIHSDRIMLLGASAVYW